MVNEQLNARLIELIHEKTPCDHNPAALLADTLRIGREAAYRRLRGEVPFTFAEAVQISEKLDFSLDRAVGFAANGNAVFNLNFTDYLASVDSYDHVIEKDTSFLVQLCKSQHTEMSMAGNQIPQSLYLRYPTLADFKLFKWLYQHDKFIKPVRTVEDMQKSPHLTHCYRNFMQAVQRIETTHYIFDHTLCHHWVQAIRYFSELGLITDRHIELLKTELNALLDEMEELTLSGCHPNGNRVNIYVSELDIEANYLSFSSDDHKEARIEVFSLNALHTNNPEIAAPMQKWIQTLRQFSTLITQSSALQRFRFFSRQRELVSSIGS